MTAKRKPMSAAARAKLSRELKGKKHPHKGHPMSAAARAKISAALRGKRHKGHRESSATRAKISAKLRADALRRRKARLSRAMERAKARKAKRLRVSHHHGTTFGPHRRRLHKRPPHYIRHRRTTGKHVRLARLHRPHPQRISRHHRLSSLNRRRRKFG